MVFTDILLNKGTIGNDIIRSHDIFVTHTKFLDKIHNLLVFLSLPEMESRIRSILKYVNCTSKVLGIKGSSTLKAFSIYQDCITVICDILPRMILEFEFLHVVQSLHQVSIRIVKSGSHGGYIDIGSGFCQGHQFK